MTADARPPKRGLAARATIFDVAAAAGVDASTVSRVLRGERSQRVRAETRERIVEAAQRLDYRPNVIARSLRSAKTYSLGIVVPQLDNPVFAMAIEGAERAARQRGYSLLISRLEPGDPQSGLYERLSQLNRVDGLLVATLDEDRLLLDSLARARVPFVVLNRRVPGVANCVALDTRTAARQAIDHLAGLGHRRIGHLAGRLDGFNGSERLAGYRDGLDAHAIPWDPDLVASAGYTAPGGATAMAELLGRSAEPPTAVFAATLVSATGALSVLHARGIKVPGRVSVMALHDSLIAEMLHPPLTTVSLPAEAMGREGAIGLIDLIEGIRTEVGAILPPDGLVARDSTGPPAA
jgi:LacI family transcriptional regulator